MSYINELKQKESQLISLEAKVIAKKQAVEDMVEKKKKAESEVQSKLGISLSDVPEELELTKQKYKDLLGQLESSIKEIEDEFTKINC